MSTKAADWVYEREWWLFSPTQGPVRQSAIAVTAVVFDSRIPDADKAYIVVRVPPGVAAKVTFSVDGHYDLGDLLDPAISQMRALYRDARLSANSWRDAERVAAIQKREKAFDEAASLAKVEQCQINPSVHYYRSANL